MELRITRLISFTLVILNVITTSVICANNSASIPQITPFKITIRPLATTGQINRNQISNPRPLPFNGDEDDDGLGIFEKVKLSSSNDVEAPEPPPHQQIAKMARFIVSQSIWTSLATISTRSPTIGSPFQTILSVSDGTKRKSTGIPYLYLTPLDLGAIDLQVNPNASLVMSLAQGRFCNSKYYDPEDPRCAMASLSGQIVKIPPNSTEERIARSALFSKHPVMRTWPKDHNWFFAKLNISQILIRDYFGGAKTVDLDEYYSLTNNSRISSWPWRLKRKLHELKLV